MHWQVEVRREPGASEVFERTDADGTTEPVRLDDSPSLILLAAVASCFLRSCVAALEARGAPEPSLRVNVTGHKAADRPNRMERIVLSCDIGGVAGDEKARVVRDAKRLCTVSNSLACDLDVVG